MRTRLTGAYARAAYELTLGLGQGWLRDLAVDADGDSLEICLVGLDRYRTRGSATERSFATVIAAICAAGDDVRLTPAPTGAEVIAALHRGGDHHRQAALLAACRHLVTDE
jgi:hypothetical protein